MKSHMHAAVKKRTSARERDDVRNRAFDFESVVGAIAERPFRVHFRAPCRSRVGAMRYTKILFFVLRNHPKSARVHWSWFLSPRR
jgi:hypothetical protein